MPREITPEMVDALNTLLVHAKYRSTPQSVKDAINLLDNTDFFTPITDFADEIPEDQA